VEEALHYFVTNVDRMQYGTFRKAGYFIGSGVVEAGMQDRDRRTLQTIGNVLVGNRAPRTSWPSAASIAADA